MDKDLREVVPKAEIEACTGSSASAHEIVQEEASGIRGNMTGLVSTFSLGTETASEF
jgi:hypothetical protein